MKLLGTEVVGGRTEKYWLHTGDDGTDRITVEITQDAEPIIESVRGMSESPGKDFRFKARIPSTIIEELCRVYAPQWGVKVSEAYRELVRGKTNRAKRLWKMLTEGRDYRRLQAKAWH